MCMLKQDLSVSSAENRMVFSGPPPPPRQLRRSSTLIFLSVPMKCSEAFEGARAGRRAQAREPAQAPADTLLKEDRRCECEAACEFRYRELVADALQMPQLAADSRAQRIVVGRKLIGVRAFQARPDGAFQAIGNVALHSMIEQVDGTEILNRVDRGR